MKFIPDAEPPLPFAVVEAEPGEALEVEEPPFSAAVPVPQYWLSKMPGAMCVGPSAAQAALGTLP